MQFLICGADNTALGIGVPGTTYNFIAATHQSSWNTTETNRDTPVAAAIDLKEMVVRIATAPGAGSTRVFTVMVNGAATACAVTISGTNIQNTVTGLSVAVAAGDTISLRAEATTAPADTTDVYWSILAESVSTHYFVMFGGSGTNASATTDNYQQVQSGTGTWLTTSSAAAQVMPLAGNATALYTTINSAPGSGGDQYDITLLKNEVSTGLRTTYIDTDTGIKSDTDSIAYIAGDTIAIWSQVTGTPAAKQFAWSVKFEPTTAGESAIMFGTADPPLVSGTEYEQLMGGGNNSWVSEVNRHSMLADATLQAIYAKIGTAPGAGKSWTFKVREELADLANAVLTISDTDTTGNASFTATATGGQLHNWSVTPAGTPTAMTGGAHLGLRIFFSVAGAETITVDKWFRQAVPLPNEQPAIVSY